MQNNNKSLLKQLYILTIFFVMVGMSTGCANFRKKFIREKSKSQIESKYEPVLDPIDYAPKLVLASERYTHYHSMWKVWHRDLIQNIDGYGTDKRIHFLIAQLTLQLEEMSKYIAAEKQKELNEFRVRLEGIDKVFDKPNSFRNIESTKAKLNKIDRIIRNEFNPEKLKGFFL
jgi:hypothetical protein